MKIPEHTLPFNLEHARAGAPFSIANGEEVEVLKWDRKHAQCIVTVSRQDAAIRSYCADGTASHIDPKFHLVMTPLGYIDGKPVFVGDKFVLDDGLAPPSNHIAGPRDRAFGNCRWPAPKPVYPETRMTDDEIAQHLELSGIAFKHLRAVANAALRHAIEQGQVVVPTADGAIDIKGIGVLAGDKAAVGHVAKLIVLADGRAARDMAIAEAVREACITDVDRNHNRAARELRGLNLAAIIATVQEGR